MVKGLDVFREHCMGFEDQYVLIGGAACDVLFTNNEGNFRATRDLDMVLIVEALTPEFGNRFWELIEAGGYRNKVTSMGTPQFYRFDKPINENYPKMIELFAKTEYVLKGKNDLTPLHVGDDVSSLSAILLNEDYYRILLEGRAVVQGMSVLRPEYLVLFKAKAYLDLSEKQAAGETIDSRDIKKHKNDILRILAEFMLERVSKLPEGVHNDIREFVIRLEREPFDVNIRKNYGVSNGDLMERLREIYDV